jgi:hypothetical protein
MGLFTERETDDKINNWIARKGNVIASVLFVFGYTVLIFLLGAIWQLEQDLKQVKQLEIHTKIIEYRMGTTTLGRDTVNVFEETPKPKMKAYKFD